MAKFEPRLDQIDGLSEDLKKLGQLSNEGAWAILAPAGEFLREKFMDKIRAVFTKYSTGKLATMIESMNKQNGDGPYIQVYPYGTHHAYQGRTKTKAYKRSKHGRTYTYGGGSKKATASEVAFILEYGAPSRNIPASHWMENTINENLDGISQKIQEGFDALCDQKGIL